MRVTGTSTKLVASLRVRALYFADPNAPTDEIVSVVTRQTPTPPNALSHLSQLPLIPSTASPIALALTIAIFPVDLTPSATLTF